MCFEKATISTLLVCSLVKQETVPSELLSSHVQLSREERGLSTFERAFYFWNNTKWNVSEMLLYRQNRDVTEASFSPTLLQQYQNSDEVLAILFIDAVNIPSIVIVPSSPFYWMNLW